MSSQFHLTLDSLVRDHLHEFHLAMQGTGPLRDSRGRVVMLLIERGSSQLSGESDSDQGFFRLALITQLSLTLINTILILYILELCLVSLFAWILRNQTHPAVTGVLLYRPLFLLEDLSELIALLGFNEERCGVMLLLPLPRVLKERGASLVSLSLLIQVTLVCGY